MDYKKIGEFICELRKEKDMTQKDLADKLHITEQAVSKWERGRGCPDISLFKPLSKTLDVSINELMNGERIKDEEIKEKADDAILNALNHSHGLLNKRKKQFILVIAGIIMILYGFNTYGFSNDYFSVFYGHIYSIYDAIVIILGILSGIVAIIIGLMGRNKKGFIVIVACILIAIIGLNIYNYYNMDYINIFGFTIDGANIIRFIIVMLGTSTVAIGIMFGKSKLRSLLAIILLSLAVLLGSYIIDIVTYNNVTVGITNRRYNYDEILDKAYSVRNDNNKEVVNNVIKGIKMLQKAQKYVDKLNNKKISLAKGHMFIINYSTYPNFEELITDYNNYKGRSDSIAEDIKYVTLSDISNEAAYMFCFLGFKNSVLFPRPYMLCDFPLQMRYELQHVNDLRIFEEVLNNVK